MKTGPEATRLPERGGEPTATYRLQFGTHFRFDDARRIVPYLAELGISHLYASPLLRARPGSPHGYDIVDHGKLNPEIGDEAAFDALLAELHRHGMGLILDFVPNHMGIGPDNPWWVDVLEWGRESPYAGYFDIDWEPLEPTLKDKVLLPVLADHYGAVLERGELGIRIDAEGGTLVVHYLDAHFPIAPGDYAGLLGEALGRSDEVDRHLGSIVKGFEDALGEQGDGEFGEAVEGALGERGGAGLGEAFGDPVESALGEAPGAAAGETVGRGADPVRRRVEALRARLVAAIRNQPAVGAAIDGALAELHGTPGDPASFDRLHELLDRQRYRLSFWRVSAFEINYRRFFDIDELAGLRMEHARLFEASHALIGRLLARGALQGIRLDHVDGLRDPAGYFRRLQALTGGAARQRPYVVAEKILAADERLRADWEVDGTTGYDFMATVNRLFVDPSGERGLTRAHQRFTGRELDFEEIVVEAKRQIMRETLASELNVLATLFRRIARQSRGTRDYTLSGFRSALNDVVAHFPVYRTYVTEAGAAPEDRVELERAIRRARKTSRQPDTSIYDLIRDILTLDLVHPREKGEAGPFRRDEVVDAALRFQQYTGPVMAKAVEDTAFYRYHRLVSLNEVGGDPGLWDLPPDRLHHANCERLEAYPRSMIATATHDHKRGEDVRARLNVLSEAPREWARRTRRWAHLNRGMKREFEGRPAPSSSDEYLFYQTLVGAWPYDLEPPDYQTLPDLRDRIAGYLLKAAREAKLRTSWVAPDEEYESALGTFVRSVLDPDANAPFLGDVHELVQGLAPAGAVNGLAQVAIKLASPGVPDTYQGTELWDLSLVDPDNRRPVDYEEREAALRARHSADELLRAWRDGRIKQLVVSRLLAARRRDGELFQHGEYLPLGARGEQGHRIFAFARRSRERAGSARGRFRSVARDRIVAVVAPRLVLPLCKEAGVPLPAGWGDTTLELPGEWSGRSFVDLFTGKPLEVERSGAIAIDEVLSGFPVAALVGDARAAELLETWEGGGRGWGPRA